MVKALWGAFSCSFFHLHDRDDSIWRRNVEGAWDTDDGFNPCSIGVIRDINNSIIVRDECADDATTLWEYTIDWDNTIWQHEVYCNHGCHVGQTGIGFCLLPRHRFIQ